MCGRYTLTSSPDAIRALFGYDEQPNFPARYNIAPTQPIGIVRLVRDQAEWEPVSRPDRAQNLSDGARPDAKPVPTFAGRAPGKRHFALVRWGLLPSWVKDPKAFSLIINARGESVASKPAFRAAMKRRRCLIAADGFYEWKAGAPRKQPFYIHAKSGAPLAFAGLWETWTGPNGEELDTAAIVTTTANATLAPLHDRMPVIIPPDEFDRWLGKGDIESSVDAALAQTLIRPASDELLEAYPVSLDINRVANDNPKLLDLFTGPLGGEPGLAPLPKRAKAAKPAKVKKGNGQGTLF